MKAQVKQHLDDLQQVMIAHQLWEAVSPPAEALADENPFCVGALTPTQWLQWIFIPRMHALLAADSALPTNFAVTPYLEEALKEEAYLYALHAPLLKLEQLLKA